MPARKQAMNAKPKLLDDYATKKDLYDLSHEITMEMKDLKLENKLGLNELEKRLYAFIAKSVTFTIGTLAALQSLFHFVK